MQSDFIIELNNKNLLKSPEYTDLLTHIGVDVQQINEEYSVCLNGVVCYDTSVNNKPGIRMTFIKDSEVRNFDFTKNYTLNLDIATFRDLRLYLNALSVLKCQAIIEVNNTSIWHDANYREILQNLGTDATELTDSADMILIQGGIDGSGFVLHGAHVSGVVYITSFGVYSYVENTQGGYEIYLNGQKCFTGTMGKKDEADIHIIVMTSDFSSIVDDVSFNYNINCEQEDPQIIIRECIRKLN